MIGELFGFYTTYKSGFKWLNRGILKIQQMS